ncbi:MAG TPA: energy transducer TonB [Thermoanaerobaculia bacterium]|jgi:protein TonB|nr:energy transducer TonB [Thermoanaerobaculia bacterium]
MFEHSLIDLEAKPSPRRRWLSLPIAVGLHVVGLTAFACASYWNVGTVPDPQLADVFVVTLPPPADGGGGGPKPKPQTVQKKQPAPQTVKQLVQPKTEDIPDKPPAPASETVPALDSKGPATSDPNLGPGPGDGDCPGCPPGPGHGPGPVGPAADPGPPVDTTPIHLSFGMTKPEIVHQVQPRYSEIARRAGVQGTVIVEAVIDEQGRVTNERLIRGLPMGLDRAALEAIQEWRFKPALLDGRPVKVYFTLTVNFTIQR